MLERHKDESESLEKYRSMLMAAVIGALLLFAAPEFVGFLIGFDEEGYVQEGSLFGIPGQPRVPLVFTTSVLAVMEVVLWIARVIIVMFIVISVIMLRMPNERPRTQAPA